MERASAAQSQTISGLAAPFGFARGTMRACDFASPDPCLPGCNALHCNALQVEKSNDCAGRKDEDDAAEAAHTGYARAASRCRRRPLADGATTGGEAGRWT